MYHNHTPKHIFIDNTNYFITAAIYKKRPLLESAKLKLLLIEQIKTVFQSYNWKLHAWVVLDNHYHLLGESYKGSDLPKLIKDIHSFCGYHIKQTVKIEGRIWWNYWDYCPRNEKDYFIRQNYLLNNPYRHGYVENLLDYPFSNFRNLLSRQSEKTLRQQFIDYPEYRNLVLREAYNDDF